MKSPLPFVEGSPANDFTPSSVLVLGGSSALGAAVIQILHLAVPDCKVIVTSSRKHHEHLTRYLGADRALDRNSLSLVDEVRSASVGSQGVDAIIDVVGAATEHIFDVLDPSGPKKYAQVWTGDEEIQAPNGVDSVLFRSRDLAQMRGGENIMLSLQTLLSQSKYKLPLPIHKVGTGLDAVERGLELIRKGVSGQKLVVTV